MSVYTVTEIVGAQLVCLIGPEGVAGFVVQKKQGGEKAAERTAVVAGRWLWNLIDRRIQAMALVGGT